MAEKVLEIPESDEFYLTDNAKSVRWQFICGRRIRGQVSTFDITYSNTKNE